MDGCAAAGSAGMKRTCPDHAQLAKTIVECDGSMFDRMLPPNMFDAEDRLVEAFHITGQALGRTVTVIGLKGEPRHEIMLRYLHKVSQQWGSRIAVYPRRRKSTA